MRVPPNGVSLGQAARHICRFTYWLCLQEELFGMDKPFADNVLTPFHTSVAGKMGCITMIKERWGTLLWAYLKDLQQH